MVIGCIGCNCMLVDQYKACSDGDHAHNTENLVPRKGVLLINIQCSHLKLTSKIVLGVEIDG